MEDLRAAIEGAWERRDTVGLDTKGPVREAVEAALNLLDSGKARVAEKVAGDNSGTWRTNQWLKKAVLLSFRLNDSTLIGGGPGKSGWFDKVPSKFEGWGEKEFRANSHTQIEGPAGNIDIQSGSAAIAKVDRE